MKQTSPFPPGSTPFGGLVELVASLGLSAIRNWQAKQLRHDATSVHEAETPRSSEVRWFEPGEKGITYSSLFQHHLRGASEITIVDPHVKSFRQIRLFGELLESIIDVTQREVSIRLVTATASEHPEWAIGQLHAFIALQQSAKDRGVKLCVKFDETIHDRWVETDEWTILLGKGIDIWEASTCYSRPQEERPINKKFAVAYTATK